MKSNNKSPLSGDLISEKPHGKDGVSSAEPIKRTFETGVFSAKTVSGDPMSRKSNGKRVVCSDVPIKHSGVTGVPSAKADEVLFNVCFIQFRSIEALRNNDCTVGTKLDAPH